jgi:NADPH:quinone reductase-like Zn-dependent oxidoreductase
MREEREMLATTERESTTETMRAIVRDRYGPPDVLAVGEIAKPRLESDGVLVRVRAASVNPADWHMLTGTPFLARTSGGLRAPKTRQVGTDFAGVVEAVGSDFDGGLHVGDEVFGARNGALAEYVVVKNAVAAKPANVSFEEAAAVPVAALTALQGLRDKGGLQSGERLLVNGASGGVGTFAVQLAKAFGAEVTGVCSTRNVELVRSLGADHVVDYAREDFTRGPGGYDLVYDVAGGRSWSALKRVLAPSGRLVVAGGPKVNRITGVSMRHLARLKLASALGRRKATFYIAKVNRADLVVLQGLLADGSIRAALDRTYPFEETAEAMRYLGAGHARAKVVVTLD